MGTDDETFDHSVFSANRERMVRHEIGREFLLATVAQAREAGLMSSEHFSVDGTALRMA